jgi:DNA repair protein RadC
VDIGRELLSQFNGLRGLMNASQEQLCQQPGLGTAKYAQLQAILELSRHTWQKLWSVATHYVIQPLHAGI